jgi:hypothetical protein
MSVTAPLACMTRLYRGTRYVMKITPVEPGHRIQLPADWAAELGLEHSAAPEKTVEGILVRPRKQSLTNMWPMRWKGDGVSRNR